MRLFAIGGHLAALQDQPDPAVGRSPTSEEKEEES
jgi:hypothetical protein